MIPDIATKVYDTKEKNVGFDTFRSYRVSKWLKTVPLRPIDPVLTVTDEITNEIFFENHPDWNYKYKLAWCVREEATHVTASGICGIIIDLKDERYVFTHEYVKWDEETIEQYRNDAMTRFIGEYADHKAIYGEWHD
jgi:hypothetical protein